MLSDAVRVPGAAGAGDDEGADDDDGAGEAGEVGPGDDAGAEVAEPEVPGAACEPGLVPIPGAVAPPDPADGASPLPRRLAR